MKRPEDTAPSPFASDPGTDSTLPAARPGAPSASAALPLTEVPSAYYEIEGEQGRGGIGVVLRARDRRLDRLVALKQLQARNALAQERFEREMRVTARLQHSGIVPVHEAGCFETGVPFYAMKLLEGRSLRQRIDACASLDERLALLPHLISVAETIAYAHSRGVIHRDLKPDNVVVGDFGEAIVIDWGLAKELGRADGDAGPESPGGERWSLSPGADEGSLTVAGDVVGTPAYMPPEQARGEPADERADVWSLGATLYHLLAGVAPYQGASSAEILGRVRREPPPRLAERVAGVPDELAAIVERALSRERDARYASAAELAGDLRRFLNGQLVTVHRYTLGTLLRRWVRRHRAVLTVAAVALVALAALGAFSVTRILAAQRLAEARAESLTLAEARRSLNDDPAHALTLLASYPPAGSGWDTVAEVARAAASAGLPQEVYATSGVGAVAFAPDEQRLAILDRSGLRIVDSASGATIDRLAAPSAAPDARPSGLRWLPHGGGAVLSRFDGTFALYDPGAHSLVPLATGHGAVQDVAVDAQGEHIAAACSDGAVWIRDVHERRDRVLATHEGGATLVGFAGARVVSVGNDGAMVVSEVGGASPPTRLALATAPLLALDVGADGSHAVTADEQGRIWLVDLATGQAAAQPGLSKTSVALVGLARGQLLALNLSQELVVRQLATGEDTVLFTDASYFSLSPDRSWAAVGRHSGRLTLVHLATLWRRDLPAHGGLIDWTAIDDQGRVATVGSDGSARLWAASIHPHAVIDLGADVFTTSATPGQADLLLGLVDGRVVRVDAAGAITATARPFQAVTAARYGDASAPVVAVDPKGGQVAILDAQLVEARRFTLPGGFFDYRQRAGHIAFAMKAGFVDLAATSGGDVRRFAVFATGANVRKLRWLDDHRLVAAAATGELALVDIASSQTRALPRLPAMAAYLGSRAERLLAMNDDGTLYSLTVGDAAPVTLAPCASRFRRLIEARELGQFVAACGADVSILDGAQDTPRARTSFPGNVLALALSSDHARLAAALTLEHAALWDFRTGRMAVLPTRDRAGDVQLLGDAADELGVVLDGGRILLWRVDDPALVPQDRRELVQWLRRLGDHFGPP